MGNSWIGSAYNFSALKWDDNRSSFSLTQTSCVCEQN